MSIPLPEANKRVVTRLQQLMSNEINNVPVIRSWFAVVGAGGSLPEAVINVRLHIANLNRLDGKVLPEIDTERKLCAKFRDILEEELHEH